MKKRARWPWLLVAALLLVLAAWLATGSEPKLEDKPELVKLPRHMEEPDWQRAHKRDVLPVPALAPQQKAPEGRAAVRDPLLRALPSKVERAAVVVEANAIRNSDLGNLLVECAFAGDDQRGLEWMRDAGFDPLKDLDRIAVSDGTVMLTGNFSNVDWNGLGVKTRNPWGDQGTLLDDGTGTTDGGMSVGLWNNQMVVMGDSDDDVKAAFDRIEGRSSDTAAPVVDPSQSYGEMYGVLMAEPLASMFDKDNPALAQTIRGAAKQVQLHADASHDVGLVADVGGDDPQKSEDLRKSMGSALSLLRMEAKAKGNKDEAELLEYAHVGPSTGNKGFRLESGLPYDFMKRQLEQCIENKKKHAKERATPDAGS